MVPPGAAPVRRRRRRAVLGPAGLVPDAADDPLGLHPQADLEAVVRIEFSPSLADEILAGHRGTEVDYAVNLFWRTA